jgi:hypothetical protein
MSDMTGENRRVVRQDGRCCQTLFQTVNEAVESVRPLSNRELDVPLADLGDRV